MKNHRLFLPTQHFTVAALKDAWAYEEEEEEDLFGQGSEDASEEGSTISGTKGGSSMSKQSRLSVLGGGSSAAASGRDTKREKGREVGVEKRGNISKVVLEVEIMPGANGVLHVSLIHRFIAPLERSSRQRTS